MGNSALKDFFRNKWVRLILALDVIVIIVIIGLMISKAMRSATLVLDVSPLDATIKLNGGGEYASGTYELVPGEYKVEISHDGLDTKTFDVKIDSGEIANITTYLTNDGNIDWYKQKVNRGSYSKIVDMVSVDKNLTTDQDGSAVEQVKELEDNFQKLKNLPITKVVYDQTDTGRHLNTDITIRANYSDECSTWLCLEALMYGTDDESIIEQLLTNNGFDAEAYEIKYKVY